MLKNKTKTAIQNKFNFNPLSITNIRCDEPLVLTYTQPTLVPQAQLYNNHAYLDVPNYLKPPVFITAKPLLICLFQIVMEGLHPFLVYLLMLNKNVLNIISFPSFDGGKNNKQLKQDVIDYMAKLFGDISYAGFLETGENNVIFLKYTGIRHKMPPNYYWATVHELVNLKQIMEIPVALSLSNLFFNNPALLYLKNENEDVYETPVIGYFPAATNMTIPDELIDVYRETKNNKLGKCYYFRLKNTGNIRAVIFLGRMGMMSSHNEQKEDNFAGFNSFLFKDDDAQYYAINEYKQHTTLLNFI